MVGSKVAPRAAARTGRGVGGGASKHQRCRTHRKNIGCQHSAGVDYTTDPRVRCVKRLPETGGWGGGRGDRPTWAGRRERHSACKLQARRRGASRPALQCARPLRMGSPKCSGALGSVGAAPGSLLGRLEQRRPPAARLQCINPHKGVSSVRSPLRPWPLAF